jgi:hypothetical protein
MAAEVHTISFKPIQNFATHYFSWENSEKLVLGVFHPSESDSELRFAKILLKKAESRLLCLIVRNCRNNKSGSAGSELAVAIWHRVIQAPFDGHLSTKITSIR